MAAKKKMSQPRRIKSVAIGQLKPYANNPVKHSKKQIELVANSIEEFGWTVPILVDQKNQVIAGHARLQAAEHLGMAQVPVVVISDLTRNQVRAYRIADNRLAQLAPWLDDMLAIEFKALDAAGFDLDLTGFGIDVRESFLGTPEPDDEVPEPPKHPKTKPGDLYLLGEHRLLCGDAINAEDVSRLLNGSEMNLVVTSPPYASQRKYDSSSGFIPVPPDEYVAWFESVQALIAKHMAADGSLLLNIKEHVYAGRRVLYVKDLTLTFVREWGWRFVDEFVWTHQGTPTAPRQRFKNGWEPVFQFTRGRHKFRPKQVRHRTDSEIDWGGKHKSQRAGLVDRGFDKDKAGDHMAKRDYVLGMAYPSNVLKMATNSENLAHGAMFPVALPEFFVRAFSDEGDLVYDPFVGSGTTMIAAENTGRRSAGMEISPAYCDVAVNRWEKLTGKKARKYGSKAKSA